MDASREPSSVVSGTAEDAALRDRLHRLVGRACPAWARGHHDDIVQAAMLRMLRARASRGDDQLPGSYLWKVAYTATIDELRRLRAKREVTLLDDDGEEASAAGSSETPEDRLASDRIADGVRDCLGGLVETRRRAVTLYLAGHTVPEASRILQWTRKRMENLVYRGLADLRKCLTGKGLAP